jgi:hypothetical protein
VKIAKGAVYVRRFAAYVEDGADDPEQALMEVSNSHARLPASRGDRKWFRDGRKRDNAESAGI